MILRMFKGKTSCAALPPSYEKSNNLQHRKHLFTFNKCVTHICYSSAIWIPLNPYVNMTQSLLAPKCQYI